MNLVDVEVEIMILVMWNCRVVYVPSNLVVLMESGS